MEFLNRIIKTKFTKEKISAGLDIGASSIKIVKLKHAKDAVELCGFDLAPAEPDLAETVKKLSQAQNAASVNLSVAGPASVIRVVVFPAMSLEELRQSLKFEAQKHIPFSIDEADLDAHILKSGLPDNNMLVMLVAVKKDFLSQRLSLAQGAGLSVDLVDHDSLCLVNAFNFNYPFDTELKQKAFALLNVGASESNLVILEAASPKLSRDIDIAGNSFTQRLASVLGLDFKSAEALKTNAEKEDFSRVSSVVEPILASLANEIRISFDYYESQATANVVKIFLSGGGSLFLGLKDRISHLLDIEVDYWDPFKRLKIADNINRQDFRAKASHLAVAVGLALRG